MIEAVDIVEVTEVASDLELMTMIDLLEEILEEIALGDALIVEKKDIWLENALNVLFILISARKPRDFDNNRGGDRGGYRGRGGDRDNYRRKSPSGSRSRSRSGDRNKKQRGGRRKNSSDSR